MTDKAHLIEEFIRIRDIPYRIPLTLTEPDECCSGKAQQLLSYLQEAGYEARYRVCSFSWSDLSLPTELLRATHEDMSTHVYIEAKIGSDWINIDPTWDKALSSVFAVNDWDGESSTQVAVPVRELYSTEESQKIMDEATDPNLFADDIETNGQFYRAFNDWLAQMRVEDQRTETL